MASTDANERLRTTAHELLSNREVSDVDTAIDAIASKYHDDELSEIMERMAAIEEQIERLWEIVSNA
jgi:hypothetical protein